MEFCPVIVEHAPPSLSRDVRLLMHALMTDRMFT
jgi:hypothetical protein